MSRKKNSQKKNEIVANVKLNNSSKPLIEESNNIDDSSLRKLLKIFGGEDFYDAVIGKSKIKKIGITLFVSLVLIFWNFETLTSKLFLITNYFKPTIQNYYVTKINDSNQYKILVYIPQNLKNKKYFQETILNNIKSLSEVDSIPIKIDFFLKELEPNEIKEKLNKVVVENNYDICFYQFINEFKEKEISFNFILNEQKINLNYKIYLPKYETEITTQFNSFNSQILESSIYKGDIRNIVYYFYANKFQHFLPQKSINYFKKITPSFEYKKELISALGYTFLQLNDNDSALKYYNQLIEYTLPENFRTTINYNLNIIKYNQNKINLKEFAYITKSLLHEHNNQEFWGVSDSLSLMNLHSNLLTYYISQMYSQIEKYYYDSALFQYNSMKELFRNGYRLNNNNIIPFYQFITINSFAMNSTIYFNKSSIYEYENFLEIAKNINNPLIYKHALYYVGILYFDSLKNCNDYNTQRILANKSYYCFSNKFYDSVYLKENINQIRAYERYNSLKPFETSVLYKNMDSIKLVYDDLLSIFYNNSNLSDYKHFLDFKFSNELPEVKFKIFSHLAIYSNYNDYNELQSLLFIEKLLNAMESQSILRDYDTYTNFLFLKYKSLKKLNKSKDALLIFNKIKNIINSKTFNTKDSLLVRLQHS